MNKNDIKSQVMDKISSGEVKMKPGSYFVLIGVLSIAAVFVSALLASYLTSLAIFWLKIQTADGPAYGARRNLQEMFTGFPWWTVLVAAGLMFITVKAIRSYKEYYKIDRLKLATFIAVLILVFGIVLSIVQYPKSLYDKQGGKWRHGTQSSNK